MLLSKANSRTNKAVYIICLSAPFSSPPNGIIPPMPTHKRQRFYLPELDGLRLLAFLLVFTSHSPIILSSSLSKTLHDYGWLGVDLFLCLSAYLITRLLLAEYETNENINVRYFYIRRILRIWPLYYTIIIVVVLFVIQDQGWNPMVLYRGAGMATFTDNFIAAFIGYNHLAFSAHLWTISYEEQFYAIIPWTVRVLRHLNNRIRAIALGVLVLLGSLIRAIFIYLQIRHPAIWVLPLTHFDSILGGLALGLSLPEKQLRNVTAWVMFLLGTASITLIFFLPNTDVTGWHLILIYPLVGLGMSSIVFGVVRGHIPIFTEIIKNKIVVYLGKISYGLYVYHLAGLTLANQICNLLGITSQKILIYPVTMMIVALTLTILISIASFQLIEKPFLKLKERFTLISSRPI